MTHTQQFTEKVNALMTAQRIGWDEAWQRASYLYPELYRTLHKGDGSEMRMHMANQETPRRSLVEVYNEFQDPLFSKASDGLCRKLGISRDDNRETWNQAIIKVGKTASPKEAGPIFSDLVTEVMRTEGVNWGAAWAKCKERYGGIYGAMDAKRHEIASHSIAG